MAKERCQWWATITPDDEISVLGRLRKPVIEQTLQQQGVAAGLSWGPNYKQRVETSWKRFESEGWDCVRVWIYREPRKKSASANAGRNLGDRPYT